jgi:hypothetical protein
MENWSNDSLIHLLCAKLKKLKNNVILWHLNKNMQNRYEILCIEQKMVEIFEKCPFTGVHIKRIESSQIP